jgi:PKD domain/Secretion system C-terminal sorting domain
MKTIYINKTFFWAVLLTLSFSVSNTLYSQTFQWAQSGGSVDSGFNGGSEKITDIVADNQGNVYGISQVFKNNIVISGNPKTSYAANNARASALVSYDCNGNYRWSKILSSSDGNVAYGKPMCDLQGNLYITAGLNGNGVHFDTPIERPCTETTVGNEVITCKTQALIKYDTNGVEQWISYLEGNTNLLSEGLNKGGIGNIIAIDELGTLYLDTSLNTGTFCNGAYVNNVAGEPVPLLFPNPAISRSRHILKYNSQGQFVSGFPIDFPAQGFAGPDHKVVRSPVNGDFYFAGKYGEYTFPSPPIIGGEPTNKVQAKYIAAYNSQGAFLWKMISDPVNEYISRITDIAVDDEGFIYFAGSVYGVRSNNPIGSPIETIAGYSFPVDDDCYEANLPFLIKFNALGQPLLETHPRFENTLEGRKIVVNGNEIGFAKQTYGLRWQDRIIPTPTGNLTSGGLVRFNKDTFKIIDINYVSAIYTQNGVIDGFYNDAITADNLGNYYLGGGINTQATVNGTTVYSNGGDSDFVIVKFGTNNCNCQVPTCRFRTDAGSSPTNVQFTYQGQNVYDSVSWNFGDNSTSSQVNPTHTYTTPGIYNVCVTATNSCDTFQFCKLVDTTTLDTENFIEDMSANLEISPNPASGTTTISYDSINVPLLEIFDLSGRFITKHEPTLVKGSWQMPLEDLASGMYLVVLKENGVVKMQKKLLVK